MRLITVLICCVLLITTNCDDSFKVDLYPQENFLGKPYCVETDICENIPEGVNSTSSLRTNGKCVIIYAKLYCTGSSVIQDSDSAKIVFMQRVNSIGPCEKFERVTDGPLTASTIGSTEVVTNMPSIDSNSTSTTQPSETPSPAPENPAPAPLCDYSGRLLPLLRSWNTGAADHFYTTNLAVAAAAAGYSPEGTVGFLGRNGSDPHCTYLRPLYRLFRSRSADHFYSSHEEERTSAEALGYKLERIEGHCASEPACGSTLPLFRFYSASGRDHFYTTSAEEMEHVKNADNGYNFERIECYLWQSENAACR